MHDNSYVGLWVTSNGSVQLELFEDGRYTHTSACGRSRFRGRYEVCGDHINYWDDTGFVAGGSFATGDELWHGDVLLKRTSLRWSRQPSDRKASSADLDLPHQPARHQMVKRCPSSFRPAISASTGRLTVALLCLMLSSDPAGAIGRHVRTTSELNYHPSVVGPALAAKLGALNRYRTGLFGEESWILSIADVNAAKGTSYSSFEAWVEATPDDPVARQLAGLLERGILAPGGRFGDRGGR